MINVSSPNLPSLEQYVNYLKGIWKRNWLTNNGPLVNELELKLKEYLRVNHLLFLGNGTIALEIAIKALGIRGEIITTPFSYVATISSIVWEGCTPILVDIDPFTFNIDVNLIEQAITKNTEAILATHVFGNPCDVEKIAQIAKNYNLKVIYDGAHAFGTLFNNESVFKYGDISTVSFHATKLFHTIEGGAIITTNPDLAKTSAFMRNFGHYGPENFYCVGINGKNSEFHAAMGLCNLSVIDDLLKKRKELSLYYDQKLAPLKITRQTIHEQATYNYSYYPILFDEEAKVVKSFDILVGNNVNPRRYFYPSLDKLKYITSQKMPVADSISKRILCLPLYSDLTFEEINMISRILLRMQNY